MPKPKIALYWCCGCGGCEESILDLNEDILDVVSAVEIVFWPIAFDFKFNDLEAVADNELAVSLISGGVRTDEQEDMAKLLRRKSKLIIAHGSCAHLGGVPGLANFYCNSEILNKAYKEAPTVKNPQGILPGIEQDNLSPHSRLPSFGSALRPLDRVIEVDYYIPGCPPTPEIMKEAFNLVLGDNLPAKRSVLAQDKALCDSCSRRDSRPQRLMLKKFRRIYQQQIDSAKCFLEQGLICLGPATRGGCNERCLKADIPCRGCFGPVCAVVDQGAKAASFIASIIDSKDEKEINSVINSIPDPAGLFYKFSLAASLLGGKIKTKKGKNA
jgi:F420-non-reducing hydrogenase small subunit